MILGLNVGSGQRPFLSVPTAVEWCNVDCIARDGMPAPDLICDGAHLPHADASVDYVVLHHVLEHFGCGEGMGLVTEAYRVLKPGGSLFVFVPNLRALAHRWLEGGLTTQIYVTNLYGAYMGDESDRHKWGFDENSLRMFLLNFDWNVYPFNWRKIPGADFSKDFWIIGMECIK